LRRVLGDCLDLPAAQVRFVAGSFDSNGMHVAGRIKPALLLGNGREAAAPAIDLRFNLSHTRGMALIGAAIGREVGIDIEQVRPMEDLDAMARSVMSPAELMRWLALAETDREWAFYRLWARKEAYLKAIGLGLYRSFQEVTVPVGSGLLNEHAVQVHLVEDRAGIGRWQVRDVAVEGNFAAAICVRGDEKVSVRLSALNLPVSS